MAEGSKKPAPANAELSQSRAEEAARHQRNLWHNREEYMLRMLDGATEQVYRQEGAPSNQPQLDCVDLRRRRRETMKLCRGYCEQLGIRPREMTEKQKRHEDRCVCPDNQKYVRMRRQHFGRQNLLAWQQTREAVALTARKEFCCGDRWIERWQPRVFNIDEVPENPEPEPRREPRIPRHCMTKEEWLDFMARPRDVRGCREDRTSACGTRFKHGKVKPLTLRLLELARPHPFRVQEAIKNAGQVMNDSRLRRLVEAAEQQSALTPEQIEEIIKVDEEHRKEMKLLRWARKYRAKKRKKELAKMKRELAKAGKQPCRDRGDLEFELGEVLERLEREAGLNADDEDEDDDDGDRYSESDDDDFDFDEDDNDRVAPLSVIPVSS
ncbi:hypothetical protein TKK_0003151 [Trichogramma kaykai]